MFRPRGAHRYQSSFDEAPRSSAIHAGASCTKRGNKSPYTHDVDDLFIERATAEKQMANRRDSVARLAVKHKSSGLFRAESQKIAVCIGLLYRVQHPGRHPSRLHVIWRRTSGHRPGTRPDLTLFGLRVRNGGASLTDRSPADARATAAQE